MLSRSLKRAVQRSAVLRRGFSSLPTLEKWENSDLTGQNVFMRVDFNVPLHTDGSVADTTRISSALRSIGYCSSRGGKVVLCSHMGRPKGQRVDTMSLSVVAAALQTLIAEEHVPGQPKVFAAQDCVGSEVVDMLDSTVGDGDILLLENVRFHGGETKNDPAFAKELFEAAGRPSHFVNEAFGTAHRAHASNNGIVDCIRAAHGDEADCVAGFLLEKEYNALTPPYPHPTVAVVGGAKLDTKVTVLSQLLDTCDTLMVGGAMAWCLMGARGVQFPDCVDTKPDLYSAAEDVWAHAEKSDCRLLLPSDAQWGPTIDAAFSETDVFVGQGGDDELPGFFAAESGREAGSGGFFNIGPATVAKWSEILSSESTWQTDADGYSGTVIWNGPVGVSENDAYNHRSNLVIAEALDKATSMGAKTIVGGGDTVSCLTNGCSVELADRRGRVTGLVSRHPQKPQVRLTHVSTGGGASLEMLEGKLLPGFASLLSTE